MSKKKNTAPKFVLKNLGSSTQREFRALKRSELRKVIKMWDKFTLGCAYVPGYPQNTNTINNSLAQLKKLLCVKNWGR